MAKEQTYSIADLGEMTGISPRTIHFYIQKGLIPGVGRQGPKSRYAAQHLYTLLFIKRLQEEARLTLGEIAETLPRVPPRIIEAVARGDQPLEVLNLRSAPASEESEVKSLPGRVETLMAEMPPEAPGLPPEAASRRARRLGRLGPPAFLAQARVSALWGGAAGRESKSSQLQSSLDLLADLKKLAAEGEPPGGDGPDRWVSVPVTDDLLITAKGPSAKKVRLLERMAGHIRRILADDEEKSSKKKD